MEGAGGSEGDTKYMTLYSLPLLIHSTLNQPRGVSLIVSVFECTTLTLILVYHSFFYSLNPRLAHLHKHKNTFYQEKTPKSRLAPTVTFKLRNLHLIKRRVINEEKKVKMKHRIRVSNTENSNTFLEYVV